MKPLEPPSTLLRASAWMALALASFTIIAVAGREAARGATTTELMLHRAWLSLLGLVVWGLVTGQLSAFISTQRFGLHLVRAVTHFGGQFSWLHALPLIPLAQLFALEFTAPLWIVVLAPLLLGEKLTLPRILAALLGFAGALVAIRPADLSIGLGQVLGLTAAIGFALSMMCTKRLTTSEPPLRILFHMFLIQSVIALVLTAGHLRVPDATTCGWIGGLALFGFTAHYALVRAFSLADAIVVAPMDFLRLPLIALVGVLVYQEPLDAVILAGGVLVLVANFINIWVERRARARPST